MRAFGLSALALVLPLAGCFANEPSPQLKETWARTPGLGEFNMTKEQKAAKDDGICRGYGAQPGTPAYIQCRATQDQRRGTTACRAVEGALRSGRPPTEGRPTTSGLR